MGWVFDKKSKGSMIGAEAGAEGLPLVGVLWCVVVWEDRGGEYMRVVLLLFRLPCGTWGWKDGRVNE